MSSSCPIILIVLVKTCTCILPIPSIIQSLFIAKKGMKWKRQGGRGEGRGMVSLLLVSTYLLLVGGDARDEERRSIRGMISWAFPIP